MNQEIKDNLKELGFNNNEVKVFLALTQLGEAIASAIAKKAELPRTTAISILEKLREGNYITTHKYHGVTYYWVESPKVITETFAHKTEIAGQLENFLNNLYRSEAHFPFAKIYDTKISIRNFIEKTLTKLPKNSTIYTIDSPQTGDYAKIFSDNFGAVFLGIKKKRDITTHTLIPTGHFEKINQNKIKSQDIKIKELPPKIEFKASLWVIKDLIVHFSGNPPFIVAIKHEMVFQSIKNIYDFLWNISAPKN